MNLFSHTRGRGSGCKNITAIRKSPNDLLFQPETTARSPPSAPSITDTSARTPNSPRAVLCPPATELPEVELGLSPAAAACAASPGREEQPTSSSTSTTPLPASACSARKLIFRSSPREKKAIESDPTSWIFWLPRSFQINSSGEEEGDVRVTSAPDLRRSRRPSASSTQTKHTNLLHILARDGT
jgi:hypothetical protein